MNKLKVSLAIALTLGATLNYQANADGVSEVYEEELVAPADYHFVNTFKSNTNVLGSAVLDAIYNAPHTGLAIFVSAKDKPGIVRNYGYRLGEGYDLEFDISEVFLSQKGSELGFRTYDDLEPYEAKNVNINKLKTKQLSVDWAEFYHPLLKLEGVESLKLDGVFHTQQSPTEVITQEENLDHVNPQARFLSTLIFNHEANVVGIYFEEYGQDLGSAVLANLMYSQLVLKNLDDYREL